MLNPSEILADIIEYYKTNPRGLKGNGCTYVGCSVGLACGFHVDDWDNYGSIDEVHFSYQETDSEDEFWDHFLPKYRYKVVDFWEQVQNLHDKEIYWESNDLGGQDLTEAGKDIVEEILSEYD